MIIAQVYPCKTENAAGDKFKAVLLLILQILIMVAFFVFIGKFVDKFDQSNFTVKVLYLLCSFIHIVSFTICNSSFRKTLHFIKHNKKFLIVLVDRKKLLEITANKWVENIPQEFILSYYSDQIIIFSSRKDKDATYYFANQFISDKKLEDFLIENGGCIKC